MYENCTWGVEVEIISPDGKRDNVNATRYRNGGIQGVVVGFTEGDENSTHIWARIG